ncbi:hypothetical protein [Endozoicomonas ascidiicola]|uniref:hypothetical protein n=1 Tax=Endozoicomonas ascidiicola TaxID=1698521 RepID=UPI0012FB3228|nr:hypothetical protein [Endozoicomonas ascidiicola]
MSNKSNRIEDILSTPYIPIPPAVRLTLTFVEQLSNTVRRSIEQQHEHHTFFQSAVPKAVRRSIRSGSVLFDGLSNSQTTETTLAPSVFPEAVRFVRPFFTPPAQSIGVPMPEQMTRQPETPIQRINQQKVITLVRYLMTLSEKRQVMFIENLKTSELKKVVSEELNKMKNARDTLIEPKPVLKKRAKKTNRK